MAADRNGRAFSIFARRQATGRGASDAARLRDSARVLWRHLAGLRLHLASVWVAERQRVFPLGAGALRRGQRPLSHPAGRADRLGRAGRRRTLRPRGVALAPGTPRRPSLSWRWRCSPPASRPADWRTERVSAPVLGEPIGPVDVSGRVVWVGAGDGPPALPARPRAHRAPGPGGNAPRACASACAARARTASPRPDRGSRRSPRSRPPPAPAEPGAWDFARQAWFQRIGAVGFVYGAPQPMAVPEGEGGGLLSLLSQIRHWVSARILAHTTTPSAGPFAAALLTRRPERHREDDAPGDAGFRPGSPAGDLGGFMSGSSPGSSSSRYAGCWR